MATRSAPVLDLLTLANLHAAFDSVLEIEALLGQTKLPWPSAHGGARLTELAAEMRGLLGSLLRRSQP